MLSRARTEGHLFQKLKWPKESELVCFFGTYTSYLLVCPVKFMYLKSLSA